MTEVKWIKVVVDIFDDEKILLIESLPEADSIIVCWFKLLCLAGKQNNSGVLMLNDRIPYTDEMISTVFRRPLQTVRLALKTFESFGMIEIINGAVTIPNWGKHQKLEESERIKEQTRERVRQYRERQKLLSSNVTSNVTVTESNDSELELENKNKKKNKNVFTPPSIEEVKAYVAEKGYHVDAEFFWNYYDKGQWKRKDGTQVLNWKQTLVTWEKKDSEKPEPKKKQYTTAEHYRPPKTDMNNDEMWKLVDMI